MHRARKTWWIPGLAIGLAAWVAHPVPAASQVVVSPAPGSGFLGFGWLPYGELRLRVGSDGELAVPPLEERPYPLITAVAPCSPADSAGIRAGDVMVRINGRDARERPHPFHESRPGVLQEIELQRDGELFTVSLRETEHPDGPVTCELDRQEFLYANPSGRHQPGYYRTLAIAAARTVFVTADAATSLASPVVDFVPAVAVGNSACGDSGIECTSEEWVSAITAALAEVERQCGRRGGWAHLS